MNYFILEFLSIYPCLLKLNVTFPALLTFACQFSAVKIISSRHLNNKGVGDHLCLQDHFEITGLFVIPHLRVPYFGKTNPI
uniref:Uncharacterized protein n=1 Tax=Anguilla anguilla TaxID=7936 RepID=A0A0E9WSQ4_ANGAN